MDEPEKIQNRDTSRLERSGIRVLVATFLWPFFTTGLLFLGAGTLAWPRAWLFLAVCFVGLFGQILPLAILNPELVNHRGQAKTKKDTKPWDMKLIQIYLLLGFNIEPIVMGLDVRYYHGSSLGFGWAVLGTIVFLFASVFSTWAMLVNTHFESTVRIQHDRSHKVITTGPYAFVRHPGYVGFCLWPLSMPLIVGSVIGFIPAGLAIAVLVVRTSLEDRTLQRELTGYSTYANRVRYRLIPWLW